MGGEMNCYTTLNAGEGTIRVKKFLSLLTKGFAEHVTNYMGKVKEAPFLYNERQLDTFYAPTLYKFTETFLMQTPVQRRWSRLSAQKRYDSHGWIDYWCVYRNLVYYIELKHGLLSSRNGEPNKKVKELWAKADQQIKTVKNYGDIKIEGTKGAFGIAYMIFPIYQTFNNSSSKIADKERLLEIQNNCMRLLSPKPNWTMLWTLHKDIAGPFEYVDTIELYPGIIFAANITKIHKW